MMPEERRAPMQGTVVRGRWVTPPGTISWEDHLDAYAAYSLRYGSRQSAERIADRGGFGFEEFISLTGHAPKTWAKREELCK